MKKLLIGLSVVTFVLIACSKSNEETESTNNNGNTGGNNNNCDTVNMKYAANIQPIFQANCYSCHTGVNPNGGVNLGSHAGVTQQVNNGRLIGAITHAAGYHPMPQGAAKLDDCTINKIKDWISRGALNN